MFHWLGSVYKSWEDDMLVRKTEMFTFRKFRSFAFVNFSKDNASSIAEPELQRITSMEQVKVLSGYINRLNQHSAVIYRCIFLGIPTPKRGFPIKQVTINNQGSLQSKMDALSNYWLLSGYGRNATKRFQAQGIMNHDTEDGWYTLKR